MHLTQFRKAVLLVFISIYGLLIELGENLAKSCHAERSSIQQVVCHPEVRAAIKPKIKEAEGVSSLLILPKIYVLSPVKCGENCYMHQFCCNS